jgi:hypothetical protein
MWSTFVPFVPPSVLPGSVFGGFALLLVMLVRIQFLSILHHLGHRLGARLVFIDSCIGVAGSAQQVASSGIEVLQWALGMDSDSALYVGSCSTGGKCSQHTIFDTSLINVFFPGAL